MAANQSSGTSAQIAPSLFSDNDEIRYDPRFLERLVGKRLLTDPRVALVELVANAWDAGATTVDIQWPTERHLPFSIKDNGEGMTKGQFVRRWQTLAYNRLSEQGYTVQVINSGLADRTRRVYGRNGIGRFAAFCFGKEYEVLSSRDNLEIHYRVTFPQGTHGTRRPFNKKFISELPSTAHGTQIIVKKCSPMSIGENEIRSELAMRFLADPEFVIKLNGEQVDLRNIPESNVQYDSVAIPGLGTINVTIIDTTLSDRTSSLHGVAFHVNRRLVGDVTWRHPGFEAPVDGRSIAGKRFLFLAKADFLQDKDAIRPDWTGFDERNPSYTSTAQALEGIVHRRLDVLGGDDAKALLDEARTASIRSLQRLEVGEIQKWQAFVEEAPKVARSIRRDDLLKLAELLAKLEASRSKYSLIVRLAEHSVRQLDDLNDLLTEWTVDTAKAVLDEIRTRMTLLEELKRKCANDSSDEVADIQPLFEKGLWIFGPEFESIHFTSNQGMTSILQRIFGRKDLTGSLLRPDFVVVPDGSAGCYTYPRFGRLADGDSGELGIGRLVIVELKKPSIPIGADEKGQPWKYVKELLAKGVITDDIDIDCFVVGKTIEPNESKNRDDLNGKCRTIPMTFDSVVTRAKSRLLNLYESVRSAPFLQKVVAEFEATEATLDFAKPLVGN